MFANTPLHIKELAAMYEVSERSIKYDLESIRMWLKEQGMPLHSSPSKGIWLECGHAAQTALLQRLDEAGEGVFISQQERIACLILDLLLCNEPIPIGRFCKRYDVTRNTIVSDVALAENLLSEHRLAIERTRRGLKLKAGEQERRAVLENVIYEQLDQADMLQIVQGVALRKKPDTFAVYMLDRLLESVVDVNMLFLLVANIVQDIERELGATLSDRVMIGVFIRLCIAIQRCRSASGSGYPLPADCADAPQTRLMIHSIIRTRLKPLSERYSLALTDGDVWFIGLQAEGLAAPQAQGGQQQPLPDVYMLTMELIRHVEREMQFPLQDNPDLLNSLFAHMSSRISKHSLGVVDPNPLTKDVMLKYKTMFRHVKAACTHVLREHQIFLTDADIAFIVLHFQTAYERRIDQHRWRALAVCGTGRGTAQLLTTIIESELKHIRFVATCSVMDVKKVLQNIEVDLIISNLPVPAEVPVVVVHSIPGARDFEAIRMQLGRLNRGAARTERIGDANPSYDARLESRIRDVIYTGYELSRAVIARFKRYLSEEREEGLRLHLMFMVNRAACGRSFAGSKELPILDEAQRAMKEEIEQMLRERNVSASEEEIFAILKYLEPCNDNLNDGERSADGQSRTNSS
ncbi:PRD domain-containing protein [Paenibacillus melissococcoides]|nr:transcription antiterminator BglG [Paenibacillus dendritiformis]CAH8716775.1 PRD domain-containing protein [Paenibacillus melissococcoides]CAH8717738.1 PRD domain-containing protein [Paenibacillus melissococcoides]